MRYRALSSTGDMSFGVNGANFLVDSPECVGQAILTTLKLLRGTWFLDLLQGVPWLTQVLGYGTQGLYDQLIQSVILSVPGVTPVGGIIAYTSTLNKTTRALTIAALVNTIYGPTQITTTLGVAAPFSISVNDDLVSSPGGFSIDGASVSTGVDTITTNGAI